MDIYFYDLDLNLLHILPASSRDIGYISMNAKIEFQGDGSFELSFWDNVLIDVIKAHPEGVILQWGEFEGISTDYQFTASKKTLYGKHLNGLLVKSAIVPTDGAISGNVETLVYQKINENYSWLDTAEVKGGFENVIFWRNTCKKGNEFISDLCARGHTGYKIYLDIPNKKYIFEILKSTDNPLVLSESNLNAYAVQEDFDGKNIAFGGYYKKQQIEDENGNRPDPVWTYISVDDSKTGIYKQDIVLSAETENEAISELKKCKAEYTATLKTKNIQYGIDYKLGDRVRFQQNGKTSYKTITAIELWHEKTSHGEQPVLGELKEVQSDE